MRPTVNRAHGAPVTLVAIWCATSTADGNVRQALFGMHRYVLVSHRNWGCVEEAKVITIRLSPQTLKIINAVFFIVVYDNFSYRWNITGITVAGISGSPGVTAHQLNMPTSVAVDTSKAIYISEYGNNRVQKLLPGAANGTTVAGNSNGASGTGLSALYHPYGIAIDSAGGIYVADSWNHRIVYWGNGSSVGTIVAGIGMKIEQKCGIQSALLICIENI